jgi:cytochrome c peroxidase
MGQFRAPHLSNIAVTAPYMHDGSLQHSSGAGSLRVGGHASRLRSPAVRAFGLTAAERDDLLAFLNSLTDTGFLEDPAFAQPR